MSGTLFLILAAIVLLAGLAARRRVRRVRGGRAPVVTDETLRAILNDEELGALEDDSGLDDEPLDEEEIRRAEDEFWEEEWDDPEGWRG